MSAHMDQLIAQFENFRTKVRQAETRFAGVDDMQQRVAQVEHTVTSPSGEVTVVAGAGGTVTDLRLSPGALRLDAGRLSAIIMDTLRQAVAGAVRQQAEIVDDAFGLGTGEQVRQAQAEAFAQEEGTEAPPPASQPRRRPRTGDDDDYFDDQSILRR